MFVELEDKRGGEGRKEEREEGSKQDEVQSVVEAHGRMHPVMSKCGKERSKEGRICMHAFNIVLFCLCSSFARSFPFQRLFVFFLQPMSND